MNPLNIPQSNRRNANWKRSQLARYGLGSIVALLCIYETFALHGGLPNPPLAAFYGIAATYIFRS